MERELILSHIDAEIARLTQVKALLSGAGTITPTLAPTTKPGVRTVSAEGRAKIAEAQRKRWAKLKRERKAASKVAA